jgi:hypothetical protein
MKALSLASLVIALLLPATAFADCSNWSSFSSHEAYLEPLSVPAGEIGAHLTASPWTGGVKFHSELREGDLWLDIMEFPGATSAAVAPSVVMQVGRLADDGFGRLVLAHEGQGLFAIERAALRDIGCQFIWGREGGENPIALMRVLYRKMTYFETGQPISTRFSGHLLGDTSLALNINNEIVLPAWVVPDIR